MKLSVTLLLLYGVATYNAKAELTSKNETVTLIKDSSEWENFMKHLKANGITEVKVQKVYNLDKVNKDEPVSSHKRYEEVKDVSEIQSEVDKIFKAPEVPLTPEQLELKELRARLAKLESGDKPTLGAQIQNQGDSALKEARERYESIVGKKGGPTWTVEQINEKTDEALKTARDKYKEAFDKDADRALTVVEIEKAISEK